MTQHQLIIEYCKEFGSILPAKQHGFPYKDGFLGSEASKRCRELRKSGVLRSERDGKFERFYLISSEIAKSELIFKQPVQLGFSCCYSKHKFGTHDPNCVTLKVTDNKLF